MAVLMYLAEGAIGLPVFASFYSGIPVLLATNGGYLLGFIPVAYLAGMGKSQTFIGTYMLFVLCSFMQLAIGGMWLSCYVGASIAWKLGVLPFIAPDILRAFIATYIVKRKA